jgi:hypothetical protein
VTADPNRETLTPSPTPSSEQPIFYEGGFRASEDAAKDLDQSPPRDDSIAEDDIWMAVFDPYIMTNDRGALIAPWSGEGKPSFEQCHATAYAEGVERVVAKRGWYCIKSTQGRVAAFQVREVTEEWVSGPITVWERPEEA